MRSGPSRCARPAPDDSMAGWRFPHGRLRAGVPPLARRSRGLLGRGGAGRPLDEAVGRGPRPVERALLPLVPRRRAEHVLQRGRPARRAGPRRAGGADLGQPAGRRGPPHHLSRAARRGGALRRRAPPPGRPARGPRHHLHADGPRGRGGDVGLRAPGRHPFGGVRRLRLARAGCPHRPRPAQAGGERLVRHRAGPADRPVQAAPRQGARALEAQARALHHPAAAAAGGPARPPRRFILAGAERRRAGGVRAGRRHRSALHPLHQRHHGEPQGHRARQRGPRRGAQVLDEGQYNVTPGEVFWAASDIGWVVGHSYIVYAPLLSGCTSCARCSSPASGATRTRCTAS